MVTQGEWALKHLDVTVQTFNFSRKRENNVSYKVRAKIKGFKN